MKLTARIKRKVSPVVKLARRMSRGDAMIFIDPMGDSAMLRRVMAAACKAGRLSDFCQVVAQLNPMATDEAPPSRPS